MLYKIRRRLVESVNTTRRPKRFQPDSGGDVPSMAGTRWTRATVTSSTLFRSKYMARWHSMAIKIIRQANQTGGNGPEIEQVPPCGIEACHQMQIWNYYKSTLSLRQRMHTHKRFPTCVGGFIRNLHKKGIQSKDHWSVFLQLGSTDVTQAIFNSISRMQIASHSSTSQESTRQDMGGVSIAISNEQQASKR